MSKTSKNVPAVIEPVEHNKVTQAILDFVSKVPASKIEGSNDPDAEARKIASAAARRAALTAGSLALPPGPLGWLTILPELTLIWKIQGQMVSLRTSRLAGPRADAVVPVPAHRRAGFPRSGSADG
jgi:hypothetical protein